MAIEANVKARAEELITEGEALKTLHSQNAAEHRAKAAEWIAAAENIARQIFNGDCAYNRQIQFEVDQFANNGNMLMIGHAVLAMPGILRNMVKDAENNLLGSVADRASAETFDDFLDHGEAYWKENRKEPAGAIVGVVFEDSVKRLCRKVGIGTEGRELDQLISALASNQVITGVEAKRARAAAGVRNKADHADWDAFSLGDVEATVQFTRSVILAKLDS
ncbi:MAG: hypothetical protein ACRD1Y_07375 [Terriglobales bacterium]